MQLAEQLLTTTEIEIPASERYARSRRHLRPLGHIALSNEIEPNEIIDFRETVDYAQAKADWKASLREMIATDSEMRKLLDNDDERHSSFKDGHARDIDGRSMVDIITSAYAESARRAAVDERYQGQAIRDWGDVLTAEVADSLPVGRAYVTTSMASRKNLQNHPKIYKDEYGYDKNLVYMQAYAKEKEDRMVAFSHSIYVTDEAIFKEVLAEFDIIIPADEDYDKWIQHGLELTANADQADALLKAIRATYYERIGLTGERYSVSEFLAANEETLDSYFDAYYPSLGKALVSKANQAELSDLAKTLLKKNIQKMDPDYRRKLMLVANSSKFTESVGDAMEDILRYAVVEDLRPLLEAKIKKRPAPANFIKLNSQNIAGLATAGWMVGQPPVAYMHQRLAMGVERGIIEERSYGGCSGQVRLSIGRLELGPELDPFAGDRQMAYGGRNPESSHDHESESGVMRCVNCPKCGTYHEEVKAQAGVFRCKNKNCNHTAKAA